MGKPCEWPKCKNLAVYGDKYATTEYGEMCPYHSLMIQLYNAKPPQPIDYKYTKCSKCGWSITSNDIELCSKCFTETAKEEVT